MTCLFSFSPQGTINKFYDFANNNLYFREGQLTIPPASSNATSHSPVNDGVVCRNAVNRIQSSSFMRHVFHEEFASLSAEAALPLLREFQELP
jgi:hypothetical protein